MEQSKYTWKDIVLINGVCYAEEFPISNEQPHLEDNIFEIDDFYEAVAKKHNVDTGDILTYMMDGDEALVSFTPNTLTFGIEDCGAYIDGIPEWFIDDIEEGDDE